MADQDWKTGGLNRQKYVIRKPCPACGGKNIACVRCNCRGDVPVSDPDAAYFVLRIDCDPETGGPHDPHARLALRHYALSVQAENLEFAADIAGWLDETWVEKGGE